MLLPRADEALSPAVAFGFPDDARGAFEAEAGDLLLALVGPVVRPVAVTPPPPTGGAVAETAEAVADPLANRLQGLTPGATLGRMETEALGRTRAPRTRVQAAVLHD